MTTPSASSTRPSFRRTEARKPCPGRQTLSARDGALGKAQRLVEPPGVHQAVCFNRHGSGTGHVLQGFQR